MAPQMEPIMNALDSERWGLAQRIHASSLMVIFEEAGGRMTDLEGAPRIEHREPRDRSPRHGKVLSSPAWLRICDGTVLHAPTQAMIGRGRRVVNGIRAN